MRNGGRKRSHGGDSSSSSSSKIDSSKKPYSHHHHHHHHDHRHHRISPPSNFPDQNSRHRVTGKRSNFISYTELPSLPPKVKILCQIIAETPAAAVERVLEDAGIRVRGEDVEEVLKLSYGHPGSAVKFFRWSGFQLNNKHTPYAWNLVVDLLGKNSLFDAMWDAIKSMRKEFLLSLSTFRFVFANYAAANRVQEAILSYEVLEQYNVPKDVAALNSLLSAICNSGKMETAKDYLVIAKERTRINAETYSILLEGFENEGDVSRARQTFSEMVADIGWDTRNIPAYDSFLCTLLKGQDGLREMIKYFDTMRDRNCYPGMKFFKFAIEECSRKNDSKSAKLIWEELVGRNICQPDVVIHKSLISLYCNAKDFDSAQKLLDEMVYNGAFPDSETYGLLFHFLIKQNRVREATPLFKEMVKNEFVPMQQDCSSAVKAFLAAKDPHMAIKVWRFMVENYKADLDETANLLVVGLRDANRLPEAVKCAEDIIERGIKLTSATLSKLKQSLCKVGKAFGYEELLRKWKNH
ncbi:hypothetical protein ABFS82_08G066200 [Erythranthe guttata]|uniref:Pentacotripeptide-repeat region of PRORP domain-containing protein n=1 Tax=Erythranthe guttata TaxID=4155 RepID=A0A022RX79_ERYGU|nr:PREDICTED: pentatricopeptide repeat-containing protein At1g77360, mitochondrial-like [Erythranthe guttata]XP_012854448.1 PREDICTED: pentatricopeptide repeat-containing protein At1g77360, mitochondrial-like [Erythranthe guttata]EYU44576.1 hypothetical protein MIMGU_mgv1a004507mg [Erythranthe guttata]|eukprot:XP_012854441.1 PREDICTED: pentatricopeptide repeat-containing protein At1g77360, mitochondrial-like [Erythranthe guttata]